MSNETVRNFFNECGFEITDTADVIDNLQLDPSFVTFHEGIECIFWTAFKLRKIGS